MIEATGDNRISVQQIADFNTALGIGAAYVSSHQPFGSYRADHLVGAIAGQIQRKHYAFAVRNKSIVGYAGWALCAETVAEQWLSGGPAPTPEQYSQGEILVLMFLIAEDSQVLKALKALGSKLYKNHTYMGKRLQHKESIRRGVIR